MRTAFVTGGSGFVGGHLVRALLGGGFRVRVLGRARSDLQAVERAGAEVVRGDLTQALDPALMDGCEVVFHVAGAVGDQVTRAVARAVNVEGTRHVLDAARAAGARRFVHTSSVAVYGFDAGTFDESAPRRRVGEAYVDSKTAAEELCEGSGLDVRILRPAVIYGPGDTGMLPRMIELLGEGKLPLIGDGRSHVGLVHVSDVVRGLVAAADHAGADHLFNVMGPDDLTWKQLLDRMVLHFGFDAPRRLPRVLAAALGHGMSALSTLRLAPDPLPISSHAVKFLTAERAYPTERLRLGLGVAPGVPVEHGFDRAWPARTARAA